MVLFCPNPTLWHSKLTSCYVYHLNITPTEEPAGHKKEQARPILTVNSTESSVEIQQQECDRKKDKQHFDSKVNRWLGESVDLENLKRHTLLSLGLVGVKHREKGLTMDTVLALAEHWEVADDFIAWAETYTPYRYSPRKKRLLLKMGCWNLNAAITNPAIASADLFGRETGRFLEINGLSSQAPLELHAFREYLDEQIGERHRRLEEQIERSRHKRQFKAASTPSPEPAPDATRPRRACPEIKSAPSRPATAPSQATPLEKRGRSTNYLRGKPTKGKKKRQAARPSSPSQAQGRDSTDKRGNRQIRREPEASLSPEERAKRQQFLEEQRQIRAYLERNPVPDDMGPMGVPQSKYRRGTYGLHSMEYDTWSRS